MNEVTEHVFPTIGRNIEHYSCPVIAGTAREEIVRCKDCLYWTSKFRKSAMCQIDPKGFCSWAVPRSEEGGE